MPNLLALLLALLVAQNPTPPPPVDWAELMQRFQTDAALLKKTGAPLDLAKIKVEKLGPGELAREVAARETSFFGESWYDELWVLARGFGLQVDPTPDAFRVTFLRVTSAPRPAWYLPSRKAIAIDEEQYSPDVRFDRTLLQALALASADQEPGGLESPASGSSTANMLCTRAWIEGRAHQQARLAAGDTGRPTLSPLELRQGGFELLEAAGIASAWRAKTRPTSGFELLHARSGPAPEELSLAALVPSGAKLVREDTLGEFGLRYLLTLPGAHPVRAIEAGIGLRADRLRVWRYADRDWEFAWRLVFERETDAQQLEELFSKLAKGTRARHGFVFDWCWATDPAREAALAQALAALPLPPASDAQRAQATESLERAELALQPHVEGERWLLPELDVAWKFPAGCEPSFYMGEAIVYLAPAEDGFRDNLCFREYPLEGETTPEKVLAGDKQSFAGASGVKLLRAEVAHPSIGPAVLLEYTQVAGKKALHQLELQLVQPGRKLALIATLLEKHWPERGAAVEALLLASEHAAAAQAPEPKK